MEKDLLNVRERLIYAPTKMSERADVNLCQMIRRDLRKHEELIAKLS